MVVALFVAGALLVTQKYIVRAVAGRWQAVGASFGDGQIYDPSKTIKCSIDTRMPDLWYEEKCFEANCKDSCIGANINIGTCRACIISNHCDVAEGNACTP